MGEGRGGGAITASGTRRAAVRRHHHQNVCFAPDGSRAYFADTHEGIVYTVKLDAEGWPEGDREVFLDLSAEGLHPDGAVVDANGCFWNAQWGASRVARYSREGKLEHVIALPPTNTSCLAFGGLDFRTLCHQRPPDSRNALRLVYAAGRAGVPEPAVMIEAGARDMPDWAYQQPRRSGPSYHCLLSLRNRRRQTQAAEEELAA